jgi:hypothetical protein
MTRVEKRMLYILLATDNFNENNNIITQWKLSAGLGFNKTVIIIINSNKYSDYSLLDKTVIWE